MNRTLFFALLVCALIIRNHAQAQDVRSQLRQIANDLSKQIEAKGKKRIVIASFLDLKNQETELGRYMADKFSIGMSSAASSLEITDRSQLAQLLRDNRLASERILDPRTIPNLGRITGAEVIITGNYTVLDNSVDITVKAIELEKGLRLAVAEGTIPRTSEINKLLGQVDESKTEEVKSDLNIPTKTNCRGQNAAGVLFTLKECRLNGRTLTCNMAVSNNRQDKSDALFMVSAKGTNIVTDNGRQYMASNMIIGNAVGDGSWSVQYNSIYGVKVDAIVNTEVNDSSIKNLQLFEIKDQGVRCLNVPVNSTINR